MSQLSGAGEASSHPSLRASEETWAGFTASPSWVSPVAPELPGCDGYERALMQAAAAVAERRLGHAPALEPSEIVARLRAGGSPHVWPRIWTLDAPKLDTAALDGPWRSWLASLPRAPGRRCGVAVAGRAGARQVIAAVVTEPLADLQPLPSRARSGQWVSLEARVIREAVGAARVVLLGPGGSPRAVPASLHRGTIRSSFSLDQAGMWRVQVSIETERGPRPALEAWIFVDQPPSLSAALGPVPGEDAGPDQVTLEALTAATLQMLNRARASEQLPPLVRDARLDALAQRHAESVRRAGQASHDAGDGSPVERLTRAEYAALRVGENVAAAANLTRAHRALWNSPAHRSNILDARFDAVGIGVVLEASTGVRPQGGGSTGVRAGAGLHDTSRDEQTRVWVCQIFVDSAPAAADRALLPLEWARGAGTERRMNAGVHEPAQ